MSRPSAEFQLRFLSYIQRLLDGRPAISGLAVPGMPMGSPGMEGKYSDPYEVIAFEKGGKDRVFSRH